MAVKNDTRRGTRPDQSIKVDHVHYVVLARYAALKWNLANVLVPTHTKVRKQKYPRSGAIMQRDLWVATCGQ